MHEGGIEVSSSFQLFQYAHFYVEKFTSIIKRDWWKCYEKKQNKTSLDILLEW